MINLALPGSAKNLNWFVVVRGRVSMETMSLFLVRVKGLYVEQIQFSLCWLNLYSRSNFLNIFLPFITSDPNELHLPFTLNRLN